MCQASHTESPSISEAQNTLTMITKSRKIPFRVLVLLPTINSRFPILKWEDIYGAQVKGDLAWTREVASLGEVDLKPWLKEKTEEDFWDQYVVEGCSGASS